MRLINISFKRSLITLFLILINIDIAKAYTGPDVASWQHPNKASINWLKVRLSGEKFAFVKATEGISYINPYYFQDSAEIKLVGMLRGTYHYARPQYSPEAQSVFFATIAAGTILPGDLPPVLDLEQTGGLSPSQLIKWTNRFLITLQKITKRKPIIYTYPSFWRTAMANTTKFNNYPLWIADYNNSNAPTYPLPGGWKNWKFWQNTDTASIPGITGKVDHNIYNYDSGSLNSFAFGLS